TEDPKAAKARGSKSIVNRAVVRVITPGTLTEDRLLDGSRANWLLAVFPGPADVGLAWADISTGELWLAAAAAQDLADELARIGPAETLWPEGSGRGKELPRAAFDSLAAERALCARLQVQTLDGFGAFPRAALAAAGGLLRQIELTARGAQVLLAPPRLWREGSAMAVDAATRRSLELTEGASSLLAAIDLTVTAAGGRLLAGELAAPLCDIALVDDRLDLVQWFASDGSLRAAVRSQLKRAPDVARALGRIAAGRGGPRDLAALRDGLGAAEALGGLLDAASAGGVPHALGPLRTGLQPPSRLLAELRQALVDSPPTSAGDGGVIASGYDLALDAVRLLATDSRTAIAALEADLRAQTGVATLKVRHNNVIGYHVEVPSRFGEPMLANPAFVHRQTLGTAMRFDTATLRDLAGRIVQAHAQALAAEAAHLEALREAALLAADGLGRVAHGLAAL
ncbi:MAG: DNA mismatch repair protein MutS, partial [Sandaracinobacteroides sp.]